MNIVMLKLIIILKLITFVHYSKVAVATATQNFHFVENLISPGDSVFSSFSSSSSSLKLLGIDRSSERSSLLSLFSSTSSSSSTSTTTTPSAWVTATNWGSQSVDHCNWFGVSCSNVSGVLTVTALSLSSNNLVGTIPESIGQLTHLTKIDMSTNSLFGVLPSSIGSLSSLTQLSLQSNSLSGPIPSSFASLRALTLLRLTANKLSGPIPSFLGTHLVNLQKIRLGTNALQGTIPPEIGLLQQLTFLAVSTNLLYGTIPASLGNCSQLSFLALGSLSMSGTIPSSLGMLSNLNSLDLSNNAFSGTIPDSLGNLQQLQTFDMNSNQLSGSLPSSFSSFVNLQYFDLSSNGMTGTIPSFFGSFSQLNYFDLHSNLFSGSIPGSLSQLGSQLLVLDFSKNQLTSSIPPEFSQLIHLSKFDLSNNLLTGEVPRSLVNLTALAYFSVAFNKLSVWSVPSSSWSQCFYIFASHNNIGGGLYLDLVLPPLVVAFDFSYNMLTDLTCSSSPPSVSSSVVQLTLSVNLIRHEIGNLLTCLEQVAPNVTLLSLNKNRVYGQLDSGQLAKLSSLQNNALANSISFVIFIPFHVDSFPSLVTLDLSDNEITGSVTDLLAKLSQLKLLQNVFLSNNNMTGYVPESAKALSQVTLENNLLITGPALPMRNSTDEDWDGSPRIALPLFFILYGQSRIDSINMYCPVYTSSSSASIQISPTYHGYQACSCLDTEFVRSGSMQNRTCQPCPKQLYCDQKMFRPSHKIKPGYYPVPLSSGSVFSNSSISFISLVNSNPDLLISSTSLLVCYNPSQCNPNNSSQYACATGADPESIMCSRCLPNYYSWGSQCWLCPTGGQVWIPLIIVLGAAILFPLAYIRMIALSIRFASQKSKKSHARGVFVSTSQHSPVALAPLSPSESRPVLSRNDGDGDADRDADSIALEPNSKSAFTRRPLPPLSHSPVPTSSTSPDSPDSALSLDSPSSPSNTSPSSSSSSSSQLPAQSESTLESESESESGLFGRSSATISVFSFWLQALFILTNSLSSSSSSSSSSFSSSSSSSSGAAIIGSIVGLSPIGIDCLGNSFDSIGQIVILLTTPFAVVAILIVMLSGGLLLRRHTSPAILKFSAIKLAFFCWGLAYMRVAQSALIMFNCVDIAGDGVLSLSAYPWYRCSGSSYSSLLTFSVLVFISFVLGLPCASFYFSFAYMRSRHGQHVSSGFNLNDPSLSNKQIFASAFIIDACESLQPSMFWMQIVYKARKLLLMSFVTLLPRGSSILSSLVLFVLFLSVVVHVRFHPYAFSFDNVIETILLSHLLFAYTCSLLNSMAIWSSSSDFSTLSPDTTSKLVQVADITGSILAVLIAVAFIVNVVTTKTKMKRAKARTEGDLENRRHRRGKRGSSNASTSALSPASASGSRSSAGVDHRVRSTLPHHRGRPAPPHHLALPSGSSPGLAVELSKSKSFDSPSPSDDAFGEIMAQRRAHHRQLSSAELERVPQPEPEREPESAYGTDDRDRGGINIAVELSQVKGHDRDAAADADKVKGAGENVNAHDQTHEKSGAQPDVSIWGTSE